MAQESERDRVVHIKASTTCKLDGHGTGVRSPRAGQRHPAMPTWINELQALAVPMIALAAAGIALQQSRSARQKLRLDLFERRFRVYDVVLQGMVDALNFNEVKVLDQSTHGLNRTLCEARFLFRARTYNHLMQIETKILQYRHSSMIMRTQQIAEGETGAAIIGQHSEDSSWLLNNTRILPSRLHDDLRVDDHLSFSLIMDSEAFKLMQSRRTGS